MTEAERIEALALQLKPEDRARIAERLLASLEVDPEIEQAWIEEAERRVDEIHSGAVQTISHEEFLHRLRNPRR